MEIKKLFGKKKKSNNGYKNVEGHPMNSLRISWSQEDIDAYYDELELILKEGIPEPFVINIDESGCDEFSEAMNTTVIAPNHFPYEDINIPVKLCNKIVL